MLRIARRIDTFMGLGVWVGRGEVGLLDKAGGFHFLSGDQIFGQRAGQMADPEKNSMEKPRSI